MRQAKQFLINVTLLLIFLQINILAQIVGKGSSQLGLAKGRPAGSYQISEVENINYFNGRVNITIPLTTVQGRGEVNVPINAGFNSPGWSTYVEGVDDGTGNGGTTPRLFASYEPIGKIYRSVEVKARMQLNYVDYTTCYGAPFYQGTVTRVYVTMPDGTEYELRDTLTDGQGMSMSIPTGCSNYPNRGRVFVSKDGSNLKFVANNDVHDDGVTNFLSGVLYFPNGEVINTSGFNDRNGNVTTLGSGVENGIWVYNVTDPIERKTSIQPAYFTNSSAINGFIKYKGFGGQERQYTIVGDLMSNNLAQGETLKTLYQLFPNIYSSGDAFDTYVISQIILPNGVSYRFKYNSYGELARLEFPTGAVVEYKWANGVENSADSGEVNPGSVGSGLIYRRVTERRLYADGTNLTSSMTISRPEYQSGYSILDHGYVEVKTFTPQLISYERHYYYGKATSAISTLDNNFTYSPWKTGHEYQTDIFDPLTSNLIRRMTQVWQQTPAGWWSCQSCNQDDGPVNNPHISETTSFLADSNQVSKRTFNYDSRNNLTDTYEYEYGNGSPGQFLRRIHTDYLTINPLNGVDYTSGNLYLLNLPSETWVSSDLNGAAKTSLTQFEYDNYAGGNNTALVSRTNVSGHDTNNFGIANTSRGNVTKVTSYGNAQNQSEAVSVYSNYDILGNVVKTIDAKGFISTIDYADRLGAADGEARSNSAPSYVNAQNVTVYPLNGQSTFAFATSATNPISYTAYTQFDYFTGQAVNTENVNGVINKVLYNDALDRPTQSVSAVGTTLEMQSNIIYDDANRRIEVKSDLNALNDNLLKSESFFDGMGRTIESRRYEADGGYVATKSIPFVMVQDAETSIWRVGTKSSNPYRPNAGEQPIWTTGLSDSLGRSIKIITPDGAVVKTEYSGNTVTVTEQAGKKRRSVSNALGQLVRIDEPDGSGNLGSVESPNQPTNYVYNKLGKMIEVTQGVQKRYFLYDSLGRLLRVRQPEQQINSALNLSGIETANTQWTAAFSYDNNGNMLTATDARNVTITNNYDALNRPVTRSYSDSVTPTVTFTYDDAAVPNSKGKLTKISSSISEMRYNSYDKVGRLLSSEQATDGQTYSSSYKYNLAGNLTEQTYPSGRVVREFLANDGNLAAISSKVWNGQFKMYAANFSYTATGVIKHLQIGNGLWESAKLNSRQQITELNLGTSPTDGSKWQLKYDYGEFDPNGMVDATRNSGNIAKQTINFSGLTQPFVQTYKYDSLDRISEAKETNNGNQTWKQNWNYDRYGNRTGFSQDIGGQQLPINNLTLPQVDPNTNRFQAGQGYNYDYDGNVIQDAEGRQFTFDGENKQTEVRDASNNVVGRYYYDGNGKRVKKATNSETVIFVYDGMGKLAAEYSTAASVQNPTTNYTATDPLGSPRVITNKLGEIVSRRDFMPFGEQLAPDPTYRTANLKYTNGDNIRQKFTGYQRDEETRLDFAEARYYNNDHGRFTAVDPLLASGKSANPQTFNRYVYTMNRPLNLTDSTGLQAGRRGLNPASNIVVPENVTAEASRTTIPGTYQTPDGTSVENATLILPKPLVQLRKNLANFAYTHQAAATSQAIANKKTSDVSPNQGTVSNEKSQSKEKESSKTVEVNGELSTSPSLGGSSSSTDTNKLGNSNSDGKQLTGPSTAITGTLNNIENQVNIAVGNYLNANSDRNGDLKIDLIDSSGNKHRGVKISRESLKIHLETFVQKVRNQADSDFGGQ